MSHALARHNSAVSLDLDSSVSREVLFSHMILNMADVHVQVIRVTSVTTATIMGNLSLRKNTLELKIRKLFVSGYVIRKILIANLD